MVKTRVSRWLKEKWLVSQVIKNNRN